MRTKSRGTTLITHPEENIERNANVKLRPVTIYIYVKMAYAMYPRRSGAVMRDTLYFR